MQVLSISFSLYSNLHPSGTGFSCLGLLASPEPLTAHPGHSKAAPVCAIVTTRATGSRRISTSPVGLRTTISRSLVRLLAQRRAQAGSSRGRVHLTFDEPVLTTREIRAVEPPCPGLDPFRITAYSLQEVVAEKLRTLLQQQEKWRSGIRMT